MSIREGMALLFGLFSGSLLTSFIYYVVESQTK